MDNKKKSERFQLEKFVSNESLRLGQLIIEDGETPDFCIQTPQKRISIEHTTLINPVLQEQEKYRDKIIKEAQARFEKNYKERLYTLITFNDHVIKAGKVEYAKYVNHVYESVEEMYLANRKFKFRLSFKRTRASYSELIEHFSVNNIMDFSHWQHFGAYIVDWVDMDWLRGRISQKSQNIKRYKQLFDENWLLMVSDFGTKASANRFDGVDFSVIESEFDRIFLYNYMPDEVQIIK